MAIGSTSAPEMPYAFNVAAGIIPGHSAVNKFGHNPNVGATRETVWDAGGIYTYMTTVATLYVSSSDAGDRHRVVVMGLDAGWNEQAVLVTLNGQNKVQIGTGETWIRVFRAYDDNTTDIDGDVYIYEDDTLTGGVPDTASKIKIKITQGFNQTLMAVWSVPSMKIATLINWYSTTGSRKETQIELCVREFGKAFRVKRHVHIFDSPWDHDFKLPLPIAAKSDIEVRASATGGGGAVSAGFDLVYRNTP